MPTLPKKTIISTALIFGIAIVTFSVYSVSGTPQQKITEQKPKSVDIETATSTYSRISDTDTDSDGLYDWEEKLWGTDPLNPDTDNDGTKDGAEVSVNRDPKKAGPDDAVSTTTTASNLIKSSSATDDFSQAFIANYVAMKNGKPMSEDEKKRLAEMLIKQISNPARAPQAQLFTTADIRLTDDNSAAAFEAYAQKVRVAADKPKNYENEAIIFTRALNTKNLAEFAKLDTVIAEQEGVLSDLSEIIVPKSLAPAHLAVMNALSKIITQDKEMRVAFSDPVRAAAALKPYADAGEQMYAAYTSLEAMLKVKNVSL